MADLMAGVVGSPVPAGTVGDIVVAAVERFWGRQDGNRSVAAESAENIVELPQFAQGPAQVLPAGWNGS